ncbi:unnamed protein product [marine sediment metagenome]|uniref:Uncharacterized protein n=1 Tax=marine sediment metagenome TaxID=412755 RepID=X0ZMT0_9ZZZZ
MGLWYSLPGIIGLGDLVGTRSRSGGVSTVKDGEQQLLVSRLRWGEMWALS